MALYGNKGDWSEPYALLKLLSEGRLYLGGDNFSMIQDIFYPIISVLRHEKERNVEFTYNDNIIVVTNGDFVINIPILEFVKNAKLCFDFITKDKKSKGSFEIPEIEEFLTSFSLNTLKAKSKLKNDITIQVVDSNTFLNPSLGFSIKSQLGSPSTLVNASEPTNFTFIISGKQLTESEIFQINNTRKFSDKFILFHKAGCNLEFESIENLIFKSNLQTIDYNFDKVLSEILLMFYENDNSSENTIVKFAEKVTLKNSIGYDLSINSSMYELMMKKFLTDYALGMRAAEVWKRDYQATGGYLIVREDGELICYHFYFTKNFEEYLYNNTQLETASTSRHGFGQIYTTQNGIQKIKLNLQIRFIK